MARLAQISDCHLFADPKTEHNAIHPFESLCAVLNIVRDRLPDGIIITGDISGDDSIESYVSLLAALDTHCPGVPWKVLPGNHDNNPHFEQVFKGHILTASDTWQLYNVNLVGLDTRYKASQGQIKTTELLAAHTQMLKGNGHPWCIVMHHPPYGLTGWMKAHECVNHQIFDSWLAKQDKVACVIHGHLHEDTSITIAGLPVLGVPATCWQYALTEDYSLSDKKAGFRLLEIDQFNHFTTDVTRLD